MVKELESDPFEIAFKLELDHIVDVEFPDIFSDEVRPTPAKVSPMTIELLPEFANKSL